MIITLQQLKDLKACQLQIDLFEDTFGESVDLSKLSTEDIDKYSLFFNVNWLAKRILTVQAWNEYKKIQGPAYDEYIKILGPAYSEYKKIEGQSLAEYNNICGQAWAEYEKILGPTLAEYYNICGRAFVRLCLT